MTTLNKKKLVDRTLTDLYYQTTHMWKGNKAIELLLKKTKIAKKLVIQMDFPAGLMASFFTRSKTHR